MLSIFEEWSYMSLTEDAYTSSRKETAASNELSLTIRPL
jgi:hypothetical protein